MFTLISTANTLIDDYTPKNTTKSLTTKKIVSTINFYSIKILVFTSQA